MKYLLIVAVIAFGLTSCVKPGSGGKAQINVHVIYDNVNLPYNLVKIKYGANGLPQDGSYDEVDTSDYAGRNSFYPLKRGDYYIYVEYAPDTSNEVFIGGAHVKITNRRGEQHVVIDLAEEDPL